MLPEGFIGDVRAHTLLEKAAEISIKALIKRATQSVVMIPGERRDKPVRWCG
jgi:hypothetical protein